MFDGSGGEVENNEAVFTLKSGWFIVVKVSFLVNKRNHKKQVCEGLDRLFHTRSIPVILKNGL